LPNDEIKKVQFPNKGFEIVLAVSSKYTDPQAVSYVQIDFKTRQVLIIFTSTK